MVGSALASILCRWIGCTISLLNSASLGTVPVWYETGSTPIARLGTLPVDNQPHPSVAEPEFDISLHLQDVVFDVDLQAYGGQNWN